MNNMKLLKIYTGESDKIKGKLIYELVLELAREQGMRGCTVYRGIAGFGSNSFIHSSKILRLSEDLPIVIDIIDEQEKIKKFIILLKDIIKDGCIVTMDLESTCIFPVLVKDIMVKDVISIHKDTKIKDVLKIISEQRIRFLPVVDENNRVVGTITGSDILDVLKIKGVDLSKEHISKDILKKIIQLTGDIKVEEIMNTDIIEVFPEQKINNCLTLLNEKGLRRAPVIDKEKRLIGVISRTDILHSLTKESQEKYPENVLNLKGIFAKDLAFKDIPVFHMNTPVKKVISKILEHPLQMAICVDDENKVVGVVFDMDITYYFLKKDRGLIFKIRSIFSRKEDIEVKRIMHTNFYWVDIYEDIITILNKMKEFKVKRLVVLDDNAKFYGVVERDTLLSFLLE